ADDRIGGWTLLGNSCCAERSKNRHRRKKQQMRSKQKEQRRHVYRSPQCSLLRRTSKNFWPFCCRKSFTRYFASSHSTRSPLCIGMLTWPSVVRKPSSWPTDIVTAILKLSSTIIGRCVSECGHTGFITRAFTAGVRIGPPAAREYAVDPVGVAMISASAL